jgi:hypothetical protein
MYCLCVNVYCHRVSTQLLLTNISIYQYTFLEISGFEMSVTFIETACKMKLCVLVQGTAIWILLIMSGIRDVITGQLDVTPGMG